MREKPMNADERMAVHEAIVDRGIELSTMGVVVSGGAGAACEVAHVVTGDVLWGHLTGTMLNVFHGMLALDVTFVAWRMLRFIKSNANTTENVANLRIQQARLQKVMQEIDEANAAAEA